MLNGGIPALPEALAPAPVWNLAGLFRIICALVHTVARWPIFIFDVACIGSTFWEPGT